MDIPNYQTKKQDLINEARLVLNGEEFSIDELKKLCSELVKLDQFAYASELLKKKIELGESESMLFSLKDHQKLVTYIYKDQSLPSSFKFKKALQILNNSDDLAITTNCETLGIAGAIYKRIWQYNHQFKNLILSRVYYKRGYDAWLRFADTNPLSCKNDANDLGYTAINFAYINELMAVDKLEEHGAVTGVTPDINERLKEADKVRLLIIEKLTPFEQEATANPDDYKWIFATLAEAYFGTRQYKSAADYIKRYLRISENSSVEESKEPIARIRENIAWEVRTFHQQLLYISYLQLFQKEYFKKDNLVNTVNDEKLQEIEENIDLGLINKCLDSFRALENDSSDHDFNNSKQEIKKDGKLGLALSGGGFRASLFHIGVLASLAEADKLKDVEVLSCVSGGSIVGAYYYLLLKKLLETKADQDIKKEDYVSIVREIETDFLKGVQNNMRVHLLTNPFLTVKMVFSKKYSRTHRIGELYEKYLYNDLFKGEHKEHIYMSQLRITPFNEPSFVLAIDNWKRTNKIPQLVLNATCINTGHNWQFTASWMGEPPGSIQTEIDVKPRLRRMYYEDAPEEYQKFRLGYAVGASSCVPVLFRPMPLPDLYPGVDMQLVDGGLHDNQGIEALIEQECNNMIISDASGQMPTSAKATNGLFGVFYRTDTILQERLRELQFKDIEERNQTLQIRELIKVHLKDGLQTEPLNWKFCTDPPRSIMYGPENLGKNQLLKFGILRDVQQALSEIRTDLDSFHDTEALALMYSGYRQTNLKLEREDSTPLRWNFLKIKKFVTEPSQAVETLEILKQSKNLLFKIFKRPGAARFTMPLLTLLPVLISFYVLYNFFQGAYTVFHSLIDHFTNSQWFIVMVIKFALGLLLLIATSMVLLILISFCCWFYIWVLNPEYNRGGRIKEKTEI